MIGTVIVIAFFTWLGWKVGVALLSFLLRGLAFILVLASVVSVLGHVQPVPANVLVAIVGFWLVGHMLFRVRFGWWNSRLLTRMAAAWETRAPMGPAGSGAGDRWSATSSNWSPMGRSFFRRQ